MTQLIQSALDAAWEAFQNTTIDLLADSDDETRRCLNNAIATYVVATERTNKIAALRQAIIDHTKGEDMFWLGECLLASIPKETAEFVSDSLGNPVRVSSVSPAKCASTSNPLKD